MRILPFVAIDDFAFRKGSYYGTLFCDLKTGQPIDLLATRNQEEITQWIKNHKAIIFMTRDGSTTYRKAIDSAERPIVQVMDRFHLLQNLYRYMVNALQRLLPQRWENIEQKKEETAIVETNNLKQEIPHLISKCVV
ncbi:MAG TPA: transposase [Bacillales bacterium]|nr:transposase [Bacillales bacterium]